MKNMLCLITCMAALLGTAAVSTSCAAFSKDDAKQLGAVLIKDALKIAKDYSAGNPVDLKIFAVETGTELATLALDKAVENIMKNQSGPPTMLVSAMPAEVINSEAERIIQAASDHAKTVLPGSVDDIAQAKFAEFAASQATSQALISLAQMTDNSGGGK